MFIKWLTNWLKIFRELNSSQNLAEIAKGIFGEKSGVDLKIPSRKSKRKGPSF